MKFSTLKRTVEPATEPITLAEAKAQLRVTHTDDDTYITALITAARDWAESFVKRSFISQTWVAGFSGWPCDGILELPRGPLLTVSSIKYRISDDTLTTLDPSNYYVETGAFNGLVRIKDSWGNPALNCDREFPLVVTYTAGYGAALPPRVPLALKIMVAHWYVHRVPVSQVLMSKIPFSAEVLLGGIKARNV